MSGPRKMIEVTVCCLSCGKTQTAWAKEREHNVPYARAECPSCSNQAFTMTLSGQLALMEAAASAIAALKLDMLDLQDTGEER